MVLVGIAVGFIVNLLMPDNPLREKSLQDYILAIVISILIWEGNLRIDHFLNERISWIKTPGRRLLIQFAIVLVYSSLALLIPMKVYNSMFCVIPPEREFILNIICLAVGLIVSVILLSFEIGSQFLVNWKNSLVEVERYKTENVKAQLQNLKDQINPHFLFNNLSVLNSLVYKDQEKASEFILQLSKVYRYLLDNQDKELVSLETELEFIRSYIFLLQIRFDKNLRFDLKMDPSTTEKYLPPMALQCLVENAIKHNEVSEDHPLYISLEVYPGYLVVKNNLQLRSHVEHPTGTGMRNLKARYRYFTEQPVEVVQNTKEFIVKLPILSAV